MKNAIEASFCDDETKKWIKNKFWKPNIISINEWRIDDTIREIKKEFCHNPL
jgi:hypothetical protein